MRYFCKNTDLKRSLLTYFFILTSSTILYAQDTAYKLQNQSFYSFLWNPRFEGSSIIIQHSQALRFIDFKASKWKNYPQQLVVTDKMLLVHLLGSGIVYGSMKDEDGLIYMKRLDNTEHFGYNINSYTFTADKKLYNIGGYGMWRWNGQLRFFQEATQQWEIEPLNKELAVSNNLPGAPIWVSADQNRLISLGYLKGNEALQGKENQAVILQSELIELDLKLFNWTNKGKLSPRVSKWLKPELLLLSLESGLLFSNFGPPYLLDLENFKIKEFVNRDIQNLLMRKLSVDVTWNKGDMVYFGELNSGVIDSLQLKSTYFQETGEQIFVQPVYFSPLIIILAVIFILSIYLVFKLRKNRIKRVADSNASKQMKSDKVLSSPYPGIEVFDAVEQSLLNLLIANGAKMGKRTGTDEVNRILGVSQKSLDMQKRKRSDVIRSINTKFKLIQPMTTMPLVDRVKSDLDARLYEYYLLQDAIEKIQAILNEKNYES
jgi:hypothetical protein